MAELLKVREITVDTMQYKDFATKEEELKVMRFYQNDLNSAKLLINVTHDKVVTDFSTATKVQIAFLKPDGKRVFQDVQNVNQMQGKYYVVLSTQTLIAYGNVVAQLRLTFPNNKVIETCKFVFAVDESIMSDTALESTNEFPVIQKAIEAGKKLEGVDIDGIIAAGAKADAALPKAGGTMTGNLLMNNPAGNISHRYSAGATPTQVGWEALTDGKFRMFDWKNSRIVLGYDPVTDMIDISRNTNVLKKAGDTMVGNLVFENTSIKRGIHFQADGVAKYVFSGDSTRVNLWDNVNATDVWTYNPTTKQFDVSALNTNLVRKTGDNTLTGALTLSGVMSRLEIDDKAGSIRLNQPTDTTTSARGIQYYEGGVTKAGIGRIRNGGDTDSMYIGWGTNPWDVNTSLTVSDTKFQYKGKNVAMRDKDGRVTLTLSSDATIFDGQFGPLADRRGNTVTIRMAVRRNAGATGEVVTTLPVDLRPLMSLVKWGIAEDGSAIKYQIHTDGTIRFYTSGKDFRLVETYVVD